MRVAEEKSHRVGDYAVTLADALHDFLEREVFILVRGVREAEFGAGKDGGRGVHAAAVAGAHLKLHAL